MKTRNKLLLIIITIMGLIYATIPANQGIGAQESVFTTTEIISIDNNTKITVSAAAPLTWTLNEPTNFTVTIRLSTIAENDSLYITYIATAYNIPGEPFPEDQKTTIVQENLTEIDQEIEKIQTRYAPENTDEFNITLSILAKTTNMTEAQEFKMDFPGKGESNITIKKNVVLPIINLPGFPNTETFVRWILIFIIVLIIVLMPALFVSYFKIQEWTKMKKRGEDK
ncbi:MAG: hypothetical protein ACTSQE_01610 [Candidatus Heimdallarchaeaceae archaeon]